jgi:hypothetical protein
MSDRLALVFKDVASGRIVGYSRSSMDPPARVVWAVETPDGWRELSPFDTGKPLGAHEPAELEVSPAMADAGLTIFMRYNEKWDSAYECVTRIYREMAAVAAKERFPRPPPGARE